MKVLVTGGTGFVGRELLRQLHEAGHAIRILARRNSRGAQEAAKRYGAEVQEGDVLIDDSLKGVARGMQAVIHLVGIISEAGHNTFENVHVGGTWNMLAAAERGGVHRFLHMSALGARPNTAVSRYHQSKWVAEDFVRKSGLDFTIFRPSLIYGPGDEFINLFAKIVRRSPVVPLLADPRVRFQPVPVQAVATAFTRALTEPKSIGQTYDLCGGEALTLAEIVGRIEAVLRKRRLKPHVPLALARCQAALLELLYGRLLRKPPPLNRDQLIMLQEDNVGDPRPANELFGLRTVPLAEGIGKYLLRGPCSVEREA